jgi:demethylmenaquinone methyltransferase/2-methoxy-6-polyprenyl-1,4-benzoquinol methylase
MSEDYQDYLRRWFDRLAHHYDRLEILIGRVRPVVLELAAPGNGSRILDAATGTGNQALAFAKIGCDVVGIDLSHKMIEVAQSKNDYPNAGFQVGDASDLPFPDDSFDVSVISFALHDMPRPMREAVLDEMSRVTVPGGSMVIADYELPGSLIHRLFIRYITPFYENKYVPDYFQYDLEGSMEIKGMEIVEKRSVLMGVGKVLKALVTDGARPPHSAFPCP